jgi:hypothetical protein
MLYAALCAGLGLRQAFGSQYVLADDVRQHVFWMFRFIDPKLFPNDPIADYFQSIAPPGFAALYHFLAVLGIDPLRASKLLPPVLGLLAAGFLFGVAVRILQSRPAAALATVLFCQCLWLTTDLCSATPRAFFYPLFTAFLYYHLIGSRIGIFITLLLQTLFFPPAVLLGLGILGFDLVTWQRGRPSFSRAADAYLFLAGTAGVSMLILCWYVHTSAKIGPLISYRAARQMPEFFGPEGRVPFFNSSSWDYWLRGSSGLHVTFRPQWFFVVFLWPVLRRLPERFPLLQRPVHLRLLAQVAASALLWFFISHALLFRLYLPSRYTQHPFRVIFTLVAAGVIAALADGFIRFARKLAKDGRPVTAVTIAGLAIVLVSAAASWTLFLSKFPRAGYVIGAQDNLYRFFAEQPRTIRIASLAEEANNLPTFSRRSIVIGVETAVPFHPRYYIPLRQRGVELVQAQYSGDLAVVQRCLREQQISFWLLDRSAFTRAYVQNNRLRRQVGQPVPALGSAWMEHPPPQCVAFQDKRFVVLDARAMLALPLPANGAPTKFITELE